MMRRSSKLPAKADAILTADWHLRDTTPACRTDDFWAAQWAKVDFVAELQEQYNCPVLHAGDLFHHWWGSRSSPLLISTAIEHLPKQFHSCYGNHDLPQHQVELVERSAIHTLEAAGVLTPVGAHAKQTPTMDNAIKISDCQVLVWHQGVWQGKVPWPGCTAPTAEEVLNEYYMYDLIVTGDFHTPCVERYDREERLLVNPGSLMRQTADQIDFRPRVYLWVADTMEAIPVYLPIDSTAVSRQHLEIVEERDKRIEAFVSRLDVKWSSELSFERNLERFLEENSVHARTEELIRSAVDE